MLKAGYSGIWEILIIALAIMWLLNSYRKNSILRKMEEQLDNRNKPKSSNKKVKEAKFTDAEEADYEIVD